MTKTKIITERRNRFIGNPLKTFIHWIFRYRAFSGRKRLRVSEIPRDLRRDIGMEPLEQAGRSFEDKWREELDRLRR
jgi:hypothetical protein